MKTRSIRKKKRSFIGHLFIIFGKILKFFWQHKILSIFLIVLLTIFLFLYRIILGPFGFLASNSLYLGGFFEERNYLILLHNESELRPTGGFITSFATIKTKNGKIDLQIYNSELVQIPTPQRIAPAPFEKLIGQDPKYRGWVFRDSNFSPDFAENVQNAKWFLNQDQRFSNIEFDGTFAIDLHVIEKLVDLYGPFDINGQKITSENLFQTLQREAKDIDLRDENAWKNRKNSFAPLATLMAKKIIKSYSKWNDLFALLEKEANEKHFLLNFSNNNLQAEIEKRNWGGVLAKENFFGINFANLGGRKGDRFLQKNFWSTFNVNKDGDVVERFTMRLSHEGTYNLQSDRFESYVRIMRPRGTKITSSNGDFETKINSESFDNHVEFSHFLVLYPGEQKLFTYKFILPYKLGFENLIPIIFYKQPGTFSDPWNITIRGVNDTYFSVFGCDSVRHTENVSSCNINLDQDKKIGIIMHPDVYPPILQWTYLTNLNEMEIRFSEEIAPNLTIRDVEIVDLNKKNNEATDSISVNAVKVSNASVILHFSGMTDQPGEFFKVKINNLQDISGNKVTRDPFYITVVQE